MSGNGTDSTGGGSRSGALDALRLFAALFVVVYHFADQAPVDPQALFPILAQGWVATDLFIMLSGFVLGRAYGEALDAGLTDAAGFLARRIKRIWPGHLVVLAGFVALVWVTAALGPAPLHPERFALADLPAQAALIHAWGLVDHLSWNAPSWTLSALIVCWAAFPFLWRAAKPFDGRPAALFLALDVVAIAAVLCRVALHATPWHLPVDWSLVRALPLFACGLLLARAAKGLKFEPGEATLTAIGAVAAGGLFLSARASDLSELGVVIALAFLILGLNASSLIKGAWAREGGRISFALFITHSLSGAVWFGMARMVESRFVLSEGSRWLLWLWSLIFAAAVAWAFDRWIDAPAQRALERLLARQPVAQPVRQEA